MQRFDGFVAFYFSYRLLLLFLTSLVLALPATLQATINDPASIHIGVLATGGKEQCFDRWRPTAAYVSEAIPGYVVNIVCLDFSEIEPAVYNGLVDFIITNPAVYLNLEYIYGITRIATLKDRGGNATSTQYGSVLFKKALRTDIQTAIDLKGKRFAAVHEMSFGGWLVARRYLQERGIEPYKDFTSLIFSGQHEAVVLAVQQGAVDAGAIRTGTLEKMADAGEIDLKDFVVIDPQPMDQAADFGILSDSAIQDQAFPYIRTTNLYPQWALAKVYHVDSDLAMKVMVAFLQMKPDSKAALASQVQGWVIPLDYFTVHKCLQELKVAPYSYVEPPLSLYQLYLKYRTWALGFLGLFALMLGGVLHVSVLNRKITAAMARIALEQREKEITLAELHEFKITLDKTNDCVFIFDPETLLFLYINHGGLEQVGYTSEEMLNMTPIDIKPDFNEPQFRALIAPLIDKSKDSIEFITRQKTKQGGLVPVEVHLQYIILPEGKSRCVAVVRNISRRMAERKERENLQAQLLSEQKLASVGQLAAGIAHEINTPSQYLGSNIDFLGESFREIDTFISQFDQEVQAETDNPSSGEACIHRLAALREQSDWDYLKEEIPKAIDQSMEGVAKIRSIVMAMKEFSHPGGKEKQPTDLNRLIETTLTISSSEWKYVAEIDKQLDAQLPQIPCLPDEMGQVFLNILVNAAHAITDKIGAHPEMEKGRITIDSRVLADQVEITFTDTGGGIPPKIKDKIFDPFFTTKEVGRGTGQGLTIAYDIIVNKHGGRIDCTSVEGEGTTFSIRLPHGGAILSQ